MYKIIKETGAGANVILMNTETGASLMIGKLSMEIVNKLRDAGYEIGADKEITFGDVWNFDITPELAKEFNTMAFKMKRPVRTKATPTMTDIKKEANKKIDALDVLLGLAKYC